MSTKQCSCNSDCNCQELPPVSAPQSVVNPAGSTSISVRVGTHASFFESLRRRLSSQDYPQLAALKARETSDPSIAMLDAWAAAGDVLTFYNERIVNESFLRTASERRSLAELSGLIGYRPGPGVASSVYLAFNLERDPKQALEETLIPKGTAVKSVPGDQELPLTFETSEDLTARQEWNAIKPRMTMPIEIKDNDANSITKLYLKGTSVPLKPNDRILLSEDSNTEPKIRTVVEVAFDHDSDVTIIALEETLFSVAKMYSDVAFLIQPFVDARATTNKWMWITDNVVKPLDDYMRGNNVIQLSKIKRLSGFDAIFGGDGTVKGWLQHLGETDPTAALTELSSPASNFVAFFQKIHAVVATTLPQVVQQVIAVCKEVAALDDAAQECFKAVLPMTGFDPNTPASVAAAKSTVDAAILALSISVLTEHQTILTALQTALGGLGAPPTAAQVTAFDVARDNLRTWWGLTPTGALNGSGGTVKGATKIKQTFGETKTKLETAGSRAEDLIKAIDDAHSIVPNIASVGASPSPEAARLTELTLALKPSIDSYRNALKSALSMSVGGSKILAQLDADFFATIRDEPKIVDQHNQAVSLADDKDVPVIVALAKHLAAIVGQLANEVEKRRDAFAKKSAAIQKRYGSLASSTVSVQAAWNKVYELLTTIQNETHDPVLDPCGLFNHDIPLVTTMDRLRGTAGNNGLIEEVRALASASDEATQRMVMGLARDLTAILSLDGGLGFSTAPGLTGITGIGQAVTGSAGAPSNERLVRVADEVLRIPHNSATDVIVQLAGSLGIVSQAELKARWQAVQNPSQQAFVHTTSRPLGLYGRNAPRPAFNKDLQVIQTLPTAATTTTPEYKDWEIDDEDHMGFINLGAELENIATPFWVHLRFGMDTAESPEQIIETKVISQSSYGYTEKTTRCTMERYPNSWRSGTSDGSIADLRTTLAVVPDKRLEITERRISSVIGRDALSESTDFAPEIDQIELSGIYLGFRPGQYVVVEGERDRLPGVMAKELRRINFVQHRLSNLPGDKIHTRVFLNRALEFTYRRESVKIYANVVHATHGETVRRHAIGSGDTSQVFQAMPIARGPLTYLTATTPSGVESTLSLRVNNLQWHEEESLLDSASNERVFVINTDEASRSTVQFGDGQTGTRLPTRRENVQAEYRVGLGTAGNVNAGTITQLAGNKPIGLKEVFNPLPATGGADPENTHQIRGNAPLAVMALDRLISVRDYSDFARNYAAIEKAVAKRFLLGGQPTVHVTIAGAGDIPIADDSDLSANLKQAFRKLGDPLQVVRIDPRELLLIFLSVRVHIAADYEWSSVESAVRARLYETFSFARRELAQAVYLNEVHSAIQSVIGVAYVDVEVFASLEQKKFQDALSGTESLDSVFESLRTPDAIPDSHIFVKSSRLENGDIRPAQIAILSPDVPDSLFITEIK